MSATKPPLSIAGHGFLKNRLKNYGDEIVYGPVPAISFSARDFIVMEIAVLVLSVVLGIGSFTGFEFMLMQPTVILGMFLGEIHPWLNHRRREQKASTLYVDFRKKELTAQLKGAHNAETANSRGGN